MSPNKVIQASMIPKVKFLFITGPNKGKKFMLEPSMEMEQGKGKQEFSLGGSNCDIEIPGLEGRAEISFKQNMGWTLSVIGTQHS